MGASPRNADLPISESAMLHSVGYLCYAIVFCNGYACEVIYMTLMGDSFSVNSGSRRAVSELASSTSQDADRSR